jgi:putative ABC transport system ATP-binding protein
MYALEDVHKRYDNGKSGIDALAGVDLTIDDGEFVAIQGPTGQGKTTLLQLLGAMDRPTSGTVSYDGRDLGQLSEAELTRLRARAFGFVFQTFNLIPTLSAGENVETALVALGVRGSQRRDRAAKALAEVGLDHRITHLPGELSGGEQQRTAIARALVKEPRVILADEPTGNLDQDTRDEVVGLLEELWTTHGVTLVVVTHDDLIATRAPRRMRLEEGRIGAEGPATTARPS